MYFEIDFGGCDTEEEFSKKKRETFSTYLKPSA